MEINQLNNSTFKISTVRLNLSKTNNIMNECRTETLKRPLSNVLTLNDSNSEVIVPTTTSPTLIEQEMKDVNANLHYEDLYKENVVNPNNEAQTAVKSTPKIRGNYNSFTKGLDEEGKLTQVESKMKALTELKESKKNR